MIDKVAVPFWLCWSAGLVIGLTTGNEIPWIVGSAIVGIIVGFAFAAHAARRRREVFHGRAMAARQASYAGSTSSPTASDIHRAA